MEQYASVQQLLKKEEGRDEKLPIYPPTVIQAVHDAKTGAPLESILAQYNAVYVQYQGNPQDTRNIIPQAMRRAGLTITYMNMNSETITERANSSAQMDNDHWGLDTNWSRIDELSLSGDISVSVNGTWIINGEDTGIKAVGPKGDSGITPWLKTIDNKLHYSYDNITWEECSENIAAWFRWKDNKIQISRDNKNWVDLTGKFTDNFAIKGYVASYDLLPTSASQGDIYGVGPTYAESDTEHTNPIYRYYVRNANSWVDNGSFNSISAGVVQETGNSETEVMSQKATTEKLTELGSELQAELQAEVTRATNAELKLRKDINNEVLRAKEAEEDLENIVNANRYGYNVTVNGLKGGIHTIETAIKDVPSKFRMLGQKITFRTENGDWATYHNESLSLDNYENVNDWVQEVGISSVQGDVNITNVPDYEDLTEAADGTIKFSDKEYNKESFSGLGRVYLRKNIVDGVNVLTQDMMSKPNTIYIIQYDYDLNGEEITIPEGCVLDFKGGSFSNGTIIGNNTNINNGLNFIFNKISLKGKWCINNLIPQWFGSKGNGINDDSESLKETIIQAIKIKSNVLIPDGKYKVKVSISLKEIFEESYTYEKGDAGIRIHGESANTILYSEDGTILSLYGINTNQRNGYLRYITIDTLRFFGNNNKVLALYMYFCQHINISNVQIEDCRGGAFHFCASMDMNIDSIDAIGIGNIYSDDDVRYGMVFDEGYYINPEQTPSRCNAIKIVNSRFESYPALINSNSSAFDIQFSNCKFEGTAKNTTKYRPIRIINGTNFTFNNCLFTIAKYEEESNPRDNGLYYCEIKSSAIHNTSIRKTNFNSCVFQTGGGLIRWMDIDETSIIDCSFGGAFGSIINETDTDDMMDSPIKLGHNNLIKDSYIYVNGSRVLDIVGSYNNVNFNIITSSNTWYPLAHIRFTDANALYNNVSIKRENGSDTNGHLVYAKPFTDENGFVNLGNNKVNFENTNNITFLTTESSINNNKFPKIIKLDGAGTIRNLRYCYDGYSVTIISANNNIISTETNSNIKLYNNRIKTYIQAGEVLNIKFICGVGYITNKTNDSNKGVDINSRPELGYNSTGFITLDSNLQKIIFYKHNKWYDAFGNNPDVVTSGLKNQRPTNITPGFVYIDKSLSPPRPIYAVSIKDSLTGEMNWVDATGTEV